MTLSQANKVSPATLLKGWDSVHLWVGNARAMTGLLTNCFGFQCSAYAGPETGRSDIASYVLEQGTIRLVVTAPMNAASSIWEHLRRHGDGAVDLAFSVLNVDEVLEILVERGANCVAEPYSIEDDQGVVRIASIGTYGETIHSIVDRTNYRGVYLPGYSTTNLPPMPDGPVVGLRSIDHIVGNVPDGQLGEWVNFYEQVLGFSQLRHFDESQISTKYSSLRSTVVWNGGKIVMPINEPAPGLKKSQIQEFIDAFGGGGVQHIAFGTDDVVQAITSLRARGVRFLEANENYFDDVRSSLSFLDLPWDTLQKLGILVDNEPDGYLLQLFTESICDRPTLFFEIIQRGGAVGFGEGNFKALFESIEREQERRGNL